jgi:hypothetical protein
MTFETVQVFPLIYPAQGSGPKCEARASMIVFPSTLFLPGFPTFPLIVLLICPCSVWVLFHVPREAA